MDPLSQGVVGAVVPQSIEVADKNIHRSKLLVIGVMGFLAGMAPDVDIFIRSSTDPLYFLQYHRQFTHSFIFIPVGGFICALLVYKFIAKKALITFKQSWLYCTLGYATHGLLDSCTSYGTQLFWPFSDYRVGWNIISIIDPLFTLPILVFFVLAIVRKQILFSRIAVIWILGYLMFGVFQVNRAEMFAKRVIEERGHAYQKLLVKPTFANTVLYKVVYETESHYEMFSVRMGLKTQLYAGDTILKMNLPRDYPWISMTSQQAADIEKFSDFSNGFLAINPENKNQIVDARYTATPNRFTPLWRIELTEMAGQDDHVKFITTRTNTQKDNDMFWAMVLGEKI